ncbi:hypothetical protein J6590_074784 [Homalodisca vitripennis]|nr:hypothetical protein J6590_074784 [Homalodisca vitripennis]
MEAMGIDKKTDHESGYFEDSEYEGSVKSVDSGSRKKPRSSDESPERRVSEVPSDASTVLNECNTRITISDGSEDDGEYYFRSEEHPRERVNKKVHRAAVSWEKRGRRASGSQESRPGTGDCCSSTDNPAIIAWFRLPCLALVRGYRLIVGGECIQQLKTLSSAPRLWMGKASCGCVIRKVKLSVEHSTQLIHYRLNTFILFLCVFGFSDIYHCSPSYRSGKSGKSQGKKQDWKSGKSQGIRSQVREKSGNFDVNASADILAGSGPVCLDTSFEDKQATGGWTDRGAGGGHCLINISQNSAVKAASATGPLSHYSRLWHWIGQHNLTFSAAYISRNYFFGSTYNRVMAIRTFSIVAQVWLARPEVIRVSANSHGISCANKSKLDTT